MADMMASKTMEERVRDFFLYTILEQERKLFDKVKSSQSLIANPIPLWYSYASAFASTTMSMRMPIWFVCSIWTVWIPTLNTKEMVGIKADPDPQGASLALVAALDLPQHITPARHIVCLAKWFLKIILAQSKERASLLSSYNLSISWSDLESVLARFYLGVFNALMQPGWLEQKVWTMSPSVVVVMPQEMTQQQIMSDLLGAPGSMGNQNILTTLQNIAAHSGAIDSNASSKTRGK